MYQADIEKLKGFIESSQRILICSHSSPDGDAVGSMLAVHNYLINSSLINKDITLVLPDSCPEYLSFLPNISLILNYQDNKDIIRDKFNSAQLIFAVDFNEPNRLGEMGNLFCTSNATKIAIDHHPFTSAIYYNLVFVDENASAAAELVYLVLQELNIAEFNFDTAISIYTGIITDTGSLSYNCNSNRVYSILADIMKFNIDAREVHDLIYNNFPSGRIKLLAYILYNKLVINEKHVFAYFSLTKKELEEYNYQEGYLEGVVNYALNIRGIKLAASFVERNNLTKISFRSKGNVDVNDLAVKYFNGGGHKNAAGANYYESIENAIKLFIELANVYTCE
ncbi:MAG: bifunctional oligoribonuclease/PAP phosphatase NrnA [Bacteroidales bacterium]|jgi:phosphoesterase RecJ-like protein|nr:bifunctional oligoribonuclease/PAP phosphatase NrnA [Bacteroidales bacterium]